MVGEVTGGEVTFEGDVLLALAILARMVEHADFMDDVADVFFDGFANCDEGEYAFLKKLRGGVG